MLPGFDPEVLIERVKKEGLYDETIRPDKDKEYGIDECDKKPHRWDVEFDKQHVLRLIDQFHLKNQRYPRVQVTGLSDGDLMADEAEPLITWKLVQARLVEVLFRV